MEFVAKNIYGLLLMTKTSIKFIVVFPDLQSNQADVNPTEKTTVTDDSKIFIEECVMPCYIPERLLTGNRPQFVRKFFYAEYFAFGTRLITNNAYNHLTDE